MNHGSLFSGIGGFDLASEWMGWENLFHCEWNPFGQKVLKHYWPNAESFNDITKTDFKKYANRIDILTGGFPCQPYSSAGKRLGKEDARHLWPEMLRAIREIQPRYVVGENVRGLTNWNGGLVFDEVQADLEAIGYEVLPFLLPACAVNAPHRRDRIWFIAYSRGNGSHSAQNRQSDFKGDDNNEARQNTVKQSERCGYTPTRKAFTNPKSQGLERRTGVQEQGSGRSSLFCKTHASNPFSLGFSRKEHREKKRGWITEKSISNYWENFPTQPPVCAGNDGISSRLDGITFPKWRNESIKAAGNAIVPQVALQIFKAIEQYDTPIQKQQR